MKSGIPSSNKLMGESQERGRERQMEEGVGKLFGMVRGSLRILLGREGFEYLLFGRIRKVSNCFLLLLFSKSSMPT